MGDGLLGNAELDLKDEAEGKGFEGCHGYCANGTKLSRRRSDEESSREGQNDWRQQGSGGRRMDHNPRDAVPRRLQQKWDVESITSTYSNTDNHPKVLKDSTMKPRKNRRKEKLIKLSNKTGMPILEEEGEDEVGSDDEEEEYVRVNKGVARNRKETKEEKKQGNRL